MRGRERRDEQMLLQAAFAGTTAEECLRHLPQSAPFACALRWLDDGAGWEAHVVLEQLWLVSRDRRTRKLLSGLIHLAAAQVKANEQCEPGKRSHLKQAFSRFREGGWDWDTLATYGVTRDRLYRWLRALKG